MYKLLFTLLFIPIILSADNSQLIQQANNLFDEANELALKDPDLAKGKYKSTVLKYKKLIENGIKNPHIYMNLGNAYFFSGDKGRAMLNYQRAYRLDPSSQNLNHNIEFLRTEAVDVPPNSSSKILKYAFCWHQLGFNLRLMLFIIFNCIFWAVLGWRIYYRKQNSWLTFSSLILSLILLGSLLTTAMQWDNSVDGIVTEREVTPRQGNGYIYEMALSGPLHSGAEFKLLEIRKNWYYIELPGGSKCWIPKRSSTLVEE